MAVPDAYADAGLLGPSPPIVTAVKTGNYLQFLILSELYANKGIVNAADNDRFVFEAQANFFNAQTGGFIIGTGVQEFGVQPDTDTELRKGSTIKVIPLTLTIPAETAALVETVLRGGSSVTYQVTTSLVLSDAAGGRHYLDSMTTTGIIVPAPILEPFIEPTAGARGTQFTINDPGRRILQGSLALFYRLGEDPAIDGINADAIEIPDPGTLRGRVPSQASVGENFISVRATLGTPSYFDDLKFSVT